MPRYNCIDYLYDYHRLCDSEENNKNGKKRERVNELAEMLDKEVETKTQTEIDLSLCGFMSSIMPSEI